MLLERKQDRILGQGPNALPLKPRLAAAGPRVEKIKGSLGSEPQNQDQFGLWILQRR
jgi:hypothetical protein